MTSRQDSTAIGIVASTVSVHKTLDTFAEEKKKEKKKEREKKRKEKRVGNGNWNTAILVRASCGYQFWHQLGEFK